MGREEEVGCPGWGFNKASLHAAGTGGAFMGGLHLWVGGLLWVGTFIGGHWAGLYTATGRWVHCTTAIETIS